VHRRHISKSIQAMALAIAYPEPTKAGLRVKGEKASKAALYAEFSGQLLSNCRTIIKEFGADSEAVTAVMCGASLDDVYQKAIERRDWPRPSGRPSGELVFWIKTKVNCGLGLLRAGRRIMLG
jgi:hypothetical protein